MWMNTYTVHCIHSIQYTPTHTWYLILSCVNTALAHWTAPTHRERVEGASQRESPVHIPAYIPAVHVIMYIHIRNIVIYSCTYIYIYPLLTYLVERGERKDHRCLYTYMSLHISIYSFTPNMYPPCGDHHYLCTYMWSHIRIDPMDL